MNILGISAFYHDSAAALVRDGEIVAAAQQERFSRKKHDSSFPSDAVDYCLRAADIDINEIDLMVFYENPAVKFNRVMDMLVNSGHGGYNRDAIENIVNLWTGYKFDYEALIREKCGYQGKIIFPLHHQSHAASAFFPSPFHEAAIVTLDGVGEYMSTTLGRGRGNKIELLRKVDFPHSLGMFYSAFTYYCGFKVNSGEYKLMGLAPYGVPRYVNLIEDNIINIKDDGSYILNLEFFGYTDGTSMITDSFRALFGGSERHPEDPITEKIMDIAASAQKVIEKAVLKIAFQARKLIGLSNLCLAGGVALNCVANGNIAREKVFDNIWVQPASGDAGGALGAALFGWYQYLRNPREPSSGDSMRGAYLGPEFTEGEAGDFLDSTGAAYHKFSEDEVCAVIAENIAGEKVVGHFYGRMEYGPRALGNRSILGDASSPSLQKDMNLKIKYRESFRPFAPSVMKEEAVEYFDFPVESPYMLMTAPVRKEIRLDADKSLSGFEKLQQPLSKIPAVTHVDYSARLQTVDKETNPRFWKILEEMKRIKGLPLVINTSFNVRGEPIVCTPQDAFDCFMGTEMDVLVIGNYILYKEEQPESLNAKREFKPD